ncbi:Uma2 family endonuclease [Oscillatoria sp. FACHB-1407]|uniref:Uma2 family endonuclease n=1 Tax=Oscillatoria sp. FACHB-1407 TaxID=2692847 RepID=UPI001686DE77|nr:Uma2 family endonuclease [Oscillatoria sp. FACHB-1407]MBD2461148.1 Uma2 family endonuclease [Oscillatoria sp. FACHB-1407]
MFSAKPYVEQTDPPRSPRETLPTMYDLPSEDPNEPGLPDEYHYLQPQLLSATFRLSDYAADQIFTAGDLNIYYDVRHPLWHKRPDWFAVVGVPRLYDQQDLRLSYVMWQEGVSPSVVVELLSPGTEAEDLGRTERETDSRPPTKWQVYEQILRVPYYVVFNRYTDELQVFTLVSGQYEALDLSEPRIWMPSLKIGLGLWQGEQRGITRQWLRWYDAEGNWIPTEAEQAQRRAERLAERLRSLGIDPDAIDEL